MLRTLDRFLPSNARLAMVSMQSADSFGSMEFFIRTLVREINGGVEEKDDPRVLPDLQRFLATVDGKLQAEDRHLIVAIDEYETIDLKLSDGTFTEDLLRMIRESIQTHRRIAWVFAGSHHPAMLCGAPWSSYLASARTIAVPSFTPEETRTLLTDPLGYSLKWGSRDDRPRLTEAFWGRGTIERIQRETAGWPHLVQLVAEAVIVRVKTTVSDGVSPELLERSFQDAVTAGAMVFDLLLKQESVLPGEWSYLSGFYRSDAQRPPQDNAVHSSLRRREIVEEANGMWVLRVPLMQRWLRECCPDIATANVPASGVM